MAAVANIVHPVCSLSALTPYRRAAESVDMVTVQYGRNSRFGLAAAAMLFPASDQSMTSPRASTHMQTRADFPHMGWQFVGVLLLSRHP